MKLLMLALLVALSASSVFASKARLNALGQDGNGGSYFIHDNRNIFYNPAHINHTKDMVTFEWGQEDGSGTNNGEGGVYMSHGDLVYGVHLGRESAINTARTVLGGTTPAGDVMDLFIGGDAGMEWGAGLYLGLRDGQAADEDHKNDSLGLRGGIISGDWEAFGVLSLLNVVEDNSAETFKGKLGVQLGASYGMGNWRYYGVVRTQDAELNDAAVETSFTQVTLGAGHTKALNERATLYSNVSLVNTMGEAEAAGTTAADTSSMVLPIVFGLEVDVKDWLTLRGSVGQNFHINKTDDDVADTSYATSNSTVVNAGASLIFGDFTVDGTFGTGDQKIGFDDDFLSQVSFNYSF